MKKVSIVAGMMALVFCISVLVGASETVLAQDHGCGHNGKGFWTNLTDEQREAVQSKVKEMKSQGASREEIHAAVTEMLKGYGIEVPEDSVGPHGPGPGGFWKDLTKEQREAVQEKIKEMRSRNASREEIHAAVAEMLKGYGIEVPADSVGPHGPGCFGPPPGGFWKDLTKEQREAVRDKIKEMRSQGSTREEIHTAVAEMLKGYGIEVPEDWAGPHGPGGFGPGPRGSWKDLTTEQREAVRNKIKEMRSQGATREEIRAAVDEMIKGYGVESPGNSKSQSSETVPAESHIIAGSYPNPFNPETQIDYTLSISEKVRIQIYNITGQLIRTFDQGYQQAGSYSLRWDGRNENRDPAASGIYLYRIEAGPYSLTNRMVLLK
jgi:DNA-binding transcriptional regulator YhcF (GntR family)